MSREKQIEFEMAEMLEIIEKAREIYANDITDHTENEYIREGLLDAGYRKQSEGEWEMFSLITSTYYGKQYYFLNKDGSVYSRASHSNMSRDEAVDEFLSIFRE